MQPSGDDENVSEVATSLDLLYKWFLSLPEDFHIGRNKISSNYIMLYNSDILVIVPITELNTAIITNNGATTMITNTDY